MKILHINYFDTIGGAGRASYRLHKALIQAGTESRMMVKQAVESDWTVEILQEKRYNIIQRLKNRQSLRRVAQFHTQNPAQHSPDIFSSVEPKQIHESQADLIHLHWFNSGMLSIEDIGQISQPTVWTLHDMWAFCGAEHITYEHRWKDGYYKNNRPEYEKGFDLNRWTWERKKKKWKSPIQIITPSQWLANCVQESALMQNWPVAVIPNAIDVDKWNPTERSLARNLLKLPKEAPILLFGAVGGSGDPNKGFDLLKATLQNLRGEISGLEIVIFGQLAPQSPPDLGFPIHYTGHLHDDLSLRLLYSAVDLMVIPSRLENLPNTGLEAHACGTPIVAFNIGGLPDIVEHLTTGYLAQPYDTADLAKGIKWVLEKREDNSLGTQARERAVKLFDSNVVAKQYLEVYSQVLNRNSAL